jgi:hypothetical protein
MKTIKTIISHYKRHCRINSENEISWFKSLETKNVIYNAAFAVDCCGRRCSHQRRLKKNALLKSYQIIKTNWNIIKKSRNFDELYEIMKSKLENVFSLGELYFYDTSFRIGAFLNLFPKEIYLHAGTRIGAKNMGIEIKNRTKFKITEIPKDFRCMKPHELEDIFCIYKKYIGRIKIGNEIKITECC